MESTDEKPESVILSTVPVKEEGLPGRVGMATIADDDERLLAQIGYTQASSFHHPSGFG